MKKTIKFGDKIIEPSIRKLSDISDVVYDTKWLDGMLKNSRKGDIDLYYMYRDLALNDLDRKVMQENNLRYDITIIPALEMGTEYVKTLGHYHPPVRGAHGRRRRTGRRLSPSPRPAPATRAGTSGLSAFRVNIVGRLLTTPFG